MRFSKAIYKIENEEEGQELEERQYVHLGTWDIVEQVLTVYGMSM